MNLMSKKFNTKKAGLLLVAAASLFSTMPTHATHQGEERREARDLRQDVRQDSRDAKQECRDGILGNADCRQEHRDTKQDGRQAARDIKY